MQIKIDARSRSIICTWKAKTCIDLQRIKPWQLYFWLGNASNLGFWSKCAFHVEEEISNRFFLLCMLGLNHMNHILSSCWLRKINPLIKALGGGVKDCGLIFMICPPRHKDCNSFIAALHAKRKRTKKLFLYGMCGPIVNHGCLTKLFFFFFFKLLLKKRT